MSIPHGMGVCINAEVERVAATSFAWRLLQKPDYWMDGGYERRGQEGYVPLLPRPEWDESLMHLLLGNQEFWLVGQDAQEMTHPVDAAMFSHEWVNRTPALLGAPGIRISKAGMGWLDYYLDAGGEIPHAWHIHISKPLKPWLADYEMFLTWMRKRLVLRPVIVTDVEAGTVESAPQKELVRELAAYGLMQKHYLSAVFWSSAYRPNRWGSSLIAHSVNLTALGKLWIRKQREWRDAVIANRPRPTWDLLGQRD